MDNQVETKWRKFATELLPKKGKGYYLRKPSNIKKAESYVYGIASPVLPTKMASEVDVYHAWTNPFNINIAKTLLRKNRVLTFAELMTSMIKEYDPSVFTYTWWIWPYSYKKRIVHIDSDGITFVKMGNKWQIVYSVQALGALVGSQGDDYEDVPKNSYFVVWENEETARKHIE